MEYVTVRQMAAIVDQYRSQPGIWGEWSATYLNNVYIKNIDKRGYFEIVFESYPGPTWSEATISRLLMADDGRVMRINSLVRFAEIISTVNKVDRKKAWDQAWYSFSVLDFEKLAPRQLSDPVERRKLAAVKARQLDRIADIDAQMAAMIGWETGNAAQKARKAELARARAVMVADGQVIDARLAELAP